MNSAFTLLDKRTSHAEGNIGDSDKYRYPDDGRHHVRQAVQLAKHAFMSKGVLGGEMPIVVDVMRTVVTIGHSGTLPHF